ncbi:hypothetical protein D3228_11135 [Leucobacter luti]|nr:hypothetical protein [Leucobacter luti]
MRRPRPRGGPGLPRRAARTLAAVTATLVVASGLAVVPGTAPARAAGAPTIVGTVTVGGQLSLAEGTSALAPEALQTPATALPVGGSGAWEVGAANTFEEASGSFAYRIFEHGARTAYSVQGEARRLGAGIADTGSCTILRDNAAGVPAVIDQAEDSPYQCTYAGGLPGPAGDVFRPSFTVQPLVWATARAVFAPGTVHGTALSLSEGRFESNNEEFLVNGARQAQPAPLDTVAAGGTSRFDAFLRNAEGNDLNGWARGDFTYRIVEDGVPTPFWIQGHVTNWRGATFEHDGSCTVYQGNPLPTGGETTGVEVDFAPYTCEGIGENLDGRGDWQVTFDVEPLAYTSVSGAQATDLLKSGCADTSSRCIYFPKSIEPITKGDPILIGSEQNLGEEGNDTVTYEYHDERAIYNSFSVSMSWEGKSNFLIESLKTTLEISYEFQIRNTTGHLWSYELEVPPRSRMSAWLTPAYHRITGDFFFEVDGKYFRAKDTWVDVPDSTTPGDVEKRITPITAVSELPPTPSPTPDDEPAPGNGAPQSGPGTPEAAPTAGAADQALARTGAAGSGAAVALGALGALLLGAGLLLARRFRATRP